MKLSQVTKRHVAETVPVNSPLLDNSVFIGISGGNVELGRGIAIARVAITESSVRVSL